MRCFAKQTHRNHREPGPRGHSGGWTSGEAAYTADLMIPFSSRFRRALPLLPFALAAALAAHLLAN